MDSNLIRIARIISSCFEILKYASFAKKKKKTIIALLVTAAILLIMVHNLINGRNFYFETDDAEDPAYVPVYWVGKWVDYSDKYGFGYQLSDNSVGVLFNDLTRVILFQDGE